MDITELARRFEHVSNVIRQIKCLDYTFLVSIESDLVFLRLSYPEKDIHTGQITAQFSRRWVIEYSDSDTKIVETAFAAVQRSMRHRSKEWFLYKGRRVYSPHFSLEARINMCDEKHFDVT